VANAVSIAHAAGARVVIMNAQPTQFDEIADALLSGSISTELPQVCAATGE
jgi:NAD-dependent SIR2 family protein deacetylase